MSLRPTPAKKVIKLLNMIGFANARQRGSHVVLKVAVVPVHPGEDIGRGLLFKIMKDAKITREEFLKLLEEA